MDTDRLGPTSPRLTRRVQSLTGGHWAIVAVLAVHSDIRQAMIEAAGVRQFRGERHGLDLLAGRRLRSLDHALRHSHQRGLGIREFRDW